MGIFHPDVLKAFSRLIGQYLKTGVTNADELLKRIIKDQKLGKLESAIDLAKLSDEEITMVQSLINENKRLMEKYELLSEMKSKGRLTDDLFEGIQLDGAYELYDEVADFRVSYIRNVSGIKNHALGSITEEFEKIAFITEKKEVRIIFMDVENAELRTNSNWAKKYGYEYTFVESENNPGMVVWTIIIEK